MDRQISKQKAFLTMVFGGPVTYSGQDMRRGHAHLVARGLNDSHFDAVIKHLGASLAELGVAPALIGEVAPSPKQPAPTSSVNSPGPRSTGRANPSPSPPVN